MRVVVKPVYYCEACGKHALTKSIERHEKSCTLNQNRECNMCEQAAGYLKPLLDDYQSRFILFEYKPKDFRRVSIYDNAWDYDPTIISIYRQPFSMRHILDDVDNCPICALAIIRILGLTFWHFRGKFGKRKFDFKAAKEAWWRAVNEAEERADHYYGGEIY